MEQTPLILKTVDGTLIDKVVTGIFHSGQRTVF